MARNKESTDTHGYTAAHWALTRVQSHLLDNKIRGTYGLYRSRQSKDDGEAPIRTEDVVIRIGVLTAVDPGVAAALEADAVASGGFLEGSTSTPD
ncbi:MAG: hypothetical protein ACE1ZA_05740 [Pseudomonadales bacterium]